MAELEAQAAENAAMREDIAALTVQLREAGDKLSESEGVIKALNERLDTLDNEKADLESALESSHREMGMLRSELRTEKAEVEEAVRDIERRFKGAEEMKARYEKRIARLREEVIRLKTASGSPDPEADEIKEIDMLSPFAGGGPVSRRAVDTGLGRKVANDENDWLELL